MVRSGPIVICIADGLVVRPAVVLLSHPLFSDEPGPGRSCDCLRSRALSNGTSCRRRATIAVPSPTLHVSILIVTFGTAARTLKGFELVLADQIGSEDRLFTHPRPSPLADDREWISTVVRRAVQGRDASPLRSSNSRQKSSPRLGQKLWLRACSSKEEGRAILNEFLLRFWKRKNRPVPPSTSFESSSTR